LRNYNVLVREAKKDIVFLHKIAPGSANKSYGIHVARLAGVPDAVLDRANVVLQHLENHHLDEEIPKAVRRKLRVRDAVQPLLFGDDESA
jgi:DNA mismatch repair protein MutS